MGAYNRVNGESASGSHWLLTDILRNQWGFNGYVVSDCDSVEDVWKYHKIVATPEEAAALAVKNGDEVNCGRTYAALFNAVNMGLITEAEDRRRGAPCIPHAFPARHVRSARAREAGRTFPTQVNQSPAHDRAGAARPRRESIVLLKNDRHPAARQGEAEVHRRHRSDGRRDHVLVRQLLRHARARR